MVTKVKTINGFRQNVDEDPHIRVNIFTPGQVFEIQDDAQAAEAIASGNCELSTDVVQVPFKTYLSLKPGATEISVGGGGGGGGATAADIANAIKAAGVPIVLTPAAQLSDTIGYAGELTSGSYTRAQILTLIGGGATKLLSMSATARTGTFDFAQGGSLDNIPTSGIVDKPYIMGSSIDDFTITVDAGSTVWLEARGV